jgi:hypothetical protein
VPDQLGGYVAHAEGGRERDVHDQLRARTARRRRAGSPHHRRRNPPPPSARSSPVSHGTQGLAARSRVHQRVQAASSGCALVPAAGRLRPVRQVAERRPAPRAADAKGVQVDPPVVTPVVGDIGIGCGGLLALENAVRVGGLQQPVQQLLEPLRRPDDPGLGVPLELGRAAAATPAPAPRSARCEHLAGGAGLLDGQRAFLQRREPSGSAA